MRIGVYYQKLLMLRHATYVVESVNESLDRDILHEVVALLEKAIQQLHEEVKRKVEEQ